MEAIHQKNMDGMNAEMKAKMQTMMEKMGKEHSMVKDQAMRSRLMCWPIRQTRSEWQRTPKLCSNTSA